ncbi:MAG: YfiR family protein [Syntrophobacteraceae bacterium]
MRSRLGRTLVLVLAVLASVAPTPTFAQGTEEYKVKAAFLFNFAKFVDWPAESDRPHDDALVVCVLGEDPFGTALESLVGKAVGQRQLSIKRTKRLEDIQNCSILYVCASEKERLQPILQAARTAHALTVSDMDQFVQQGGMIGLVSSEDKIRFRVNVKSAKASGIQISSKLLKLADQVLE